MTQTLRNRRMVTTGYPISPKIKAHPPISAGKCGVKVNQVSVDVSVGFYSSAINSQIFDKFDSIHGVLPDRLRVIWITDVANGKRLRG